MLELKSFNLRRMPQQSQSVLTGAAVEAAPERDVKSFQEMDGYQPRAATAKQQAEADLQQWKEAWSIRQALQSRLTEVGARDNGPEDLNAARGVVALENYQCWGDDYLLDFSDPVVLRLQTRERGQKDNEPYTRLRELVTDGTETTVGDYRADWSGNADATIYRFGAGPAVRVEEGWRRGD